MSADDRRIPQEFNEDDYRRDPEKFLSRNITGVTKEFFKEYKQIAASIGGLASHIDSTDGNSIPAEGLPARTLDKLKTICKNQMNDYTNMPDNIKNEIATLTMYSIIFNALRKHFNSPNSKILKNGNKFNRLLRGLGFNEEQLEIIFNNLSPEQQKALNQS